MAERGESPLTRAIRERLRDPDVLQRIRDIADEAEAAREITHAKAERMRRQVEAIEREIADADPN